MREVPCLLLNPLHAQPSSVETSMVMLQDDLFLPWMFCHVMHNEAFGAPRSNEQHWFPLVGKTQLICFLQHSRRQSPHLTGCGHCIWLIFVGWRSCDDFPCSVLLFLDQSDYTTLHSMFTLYDTRNQQFYYFLAHKMWRWNKEYNTNYSHKLLTICKAAPKLVYGLLPMLGRQWTQSYHLIC